VYEKLYAVTVILPVSVKQSNKIYDMTIAIA